MILHIMPDEKIINRTIYFFESVFPQQSKYIVLLPSEKKTPSKVTVRKDVPVVGAHYDSPDFWKQIGKIDLYDRIVIHFLSYDSARFVNKINHSCIYWIEWGADLYNGFLYRRGFKLYNDERTVCKLKHPNLRYGLYKLLNRLYTYKQYKECYKAVKKIKYFVPDSMYDEYPMFLNYYPEFTHLQYKNFFYYPIDEILGALYNQSYSLGNNVLIGNSCSYTNNHLHILNVLSQKGVKADIMAPLSYGGDERYKQCVIRLGVELFGDSFHPIEDFMSIDDYNKLLLSCNSFVFGSLRQEAVGNILIALYIGGRVYLQSSNPLLKFYKSLGLIIFSMDEIAPSKVLEKMSIIDVEANRRILDEKYSSDKMKQLIRSTFSANVN